FGFEAMVPRSRVRSAVMGGDKDSDFSITPPENTAEDDAVKDYIDDDTDDPSTEEVNERMGTKFDDKE
ncbi:MAG: hypothetical protein JWN49_725, partial [Parcubacteria group bacterium]|nr:hypothetical protein [Parcubacteria group bacterium]